MVFLILFGLLVLYKGRVCDGDCLSRETTGKVRGICTLTVILHHLSQECRTEELFQMVFTQMGLLAVAMFFFYSGFGLMKSFLSRKNYRKQFLSKRVLPILITYAGFILLYWIVDALLGDLHTPGEVLVSLVNGSPIVTDSWYVITVAVFYLVFYALMGLRKPGAILVGSLIWCGAWIGFCSLAGFEAYWYNGVLCLSLGIWAAMAEEPLKKLLKKRFWLFAAVSAAVFGSLFGMMVLRYPHGFWKVLTMCTLCSAAFVLLVLTFTGKVGTGNPLWPFLSEISLEAYLCHRIFMNLLRSRFLFLTDDTLWGMAVIVLSVAAAWVLHKLFRRICGLVKK